MSAADTDSADAREIFAENTKVNATHDRDTEQMERGNYHYDSEAE